MNDIAMAFGESAGNMPVGRGIKNVTVWHLFRTLVPAKNQRLTSNK